MVFHKNQPSLRHELTKSILFQNWYVFITDVNINTVNIVHILIYINTTVHLASL